MTKAMKTVYLITQYGVAKEANKSYAGQEAYYYFGKNNTLLKAAGSYINNEQFADYPRDYTPDLLRKYGYSCLKDAEQVINARKELREKLYTNDWIWDYTFTIVAETIPDRKER